jgi:hypothetical protein
MPMSWITGSPPHRSGVVAQRMGDVVARAHPMAKRLAATVQFEQMREGVDEDCAKGIIL